MKPMALPDPAYKRILLKLSGEALKSSHRLEINPDIVRRIASEISEIQKLGVQIGIVIGGGNIFRGISASTRGMDRVTADHMGMLATMINALALQDFLEKSGLETRVMSAVRLEEMMEPYIRRKAMAHLHKNRIVIFAAGTGNPYFTTDTAAALRASEIGACAILKGTKVDGVYDKDPVIESDAVRYDKISYSKVLKLDLRVMDATAITMCRENKIPIVVFKLLKHGNMKKVVLGEPVGTLVGG